MKDFRKIYIQEMNKNASVMDYKPFSYSDAINKGMPVGAAIGAVVGGIRGATSDKEDLEREGKSRTIESLKGAIVGLIAGGVAGASVPALSRVALATSGVAKKGLGNLMSSIGAEGYGSKINRMGRAEFENASSPILPIMTLRDIITGRSGISSVSPGVLLSDTKEFVRGSSAIPRRIKSIFS